MTAVIALSLAACGSDSDEGGSDAEVKIAYIKKQGDQQYLIDQADGAKAEAEKLAVIIQQRRSGQRAVGLPR